MSADAWKKLDFIVKNYENGKNIGLGIQHVSEYTPFNVFFATCHVLYKKYHDIFLMTIRDGEWVSLTPRDKSILPEAHYVGFENDLPEQILNSKIFVQRINRLIDIYYQDSDS